MELGSAHFTQLVVGFLAAFSVFADSISALVEPKVVVGFQTQTVLKECKSGNPPTWTWLGSKVGEIKNLANGVNKHVRFNDPR